MNFVSAKEIAKKWGVSPTRVTILAKSGRIPGATQMGREWLIPLNAKKPQDPRKHTAVAEDSFRFPFFLYSFRDEPGDRAILNKEEQQLYDAQLCYVRGDIIQASKLLDSLISSTKNRYLKIGALVTGGFCAIELGQTVQYESSLQNLKYIFSKDFPYKTDLIYFLYDLESYAKGSEQWATEFRIDPEYSFHVETGPYLLTNVAYTALINLAVHNTACDLSALELSCIGLEDRGVYFSSQMVHIFLSGIYFLQGQKSYCKSHLKKVLDMAVKHDSYYPLAIASHYLGPIYEEMLPFYPSEAAEKIRLRSERFHRGVEKIYKRFSTRTALLQLSQRDYEYIMFAVQGIKNREIAKLKGITEATVSKYYSRLNAKVNAANKKELVEHFRFSILTN